MRITAQLIEAKTDTHLWSSSYDRELSDIFAVQEEIAQSIVTAMQGEIGVYTVKVERSTEDVEAYQLFLLGRHEFYRRGPAIDGAILVLQMAVKRDPEFAQAWAYLAAAANVAWGYDTAISNEKAQEVAEHASRRALNLEPRAGLALAVQATQAYGVYGDLNKTFSLFDRALEANPDNTTIRLWIGQFNHHFGYLNEALTHLMYAYERDPLVGITNGSLGLVYMASGEEALAQPRLAKARELGWNAHLPARTCQLMLKGEYESAIAHLKVSVVGRNDPDTLPWVYALDDAGRNYIGNPDSADALLAAIDAGPGGLWQKTYLTLLFDLRDPFFNYLSRVVEESHLWVALMRVIWLPGYRDYVEDPRFYDIMREAGAVALWEQRGYPDGCDLHDLPDAVRLDCSQRYR